ncbi:hypothetical protein HMPREF1548_02294 [Clostridium sp. KLE 1755]|nr:hypothetical protein HMPREF1548_02294 [Clostridium sp. KLE 1755]
MTSSARILYNVPINLPEERKRIRWTTRTLTGKRTFIDNENF